jgi:hypothetical protein
VTSRKNKAKRLKRQVDWLVNGELTGPIISRALTCSSDATSMLRGAMIGRSIQNQFYSKRNQASIATLGLRGVPFQRVSSFSGYIFIFSLGQAIRAKGTEG